MSSEVFFLLLWQRSAAVTGAQGPCKELIRLKLVFAPMVSSDNDQDVQDIHQRGHVVFQSVTPKRPQKAVVNGTVPPETTILSWPTLLRRYGVMLGQHLAQLAILLVSFFSRGHIWWQMFVGT